MTDQFHTVRIRIQDIEQIENAGYEFLRLMRYNDALPLLRVILYLRSQITGAESSLTGPSSSPSEVAPGAPTAPVPPNPDAYAFDHGERPGTTGTAAYPANVQPLFGRIA